MAWPATMAWACGTWRHVPGDAGSLPGNIQALAVDARDRIWVAVEGNWHRHPSTPQAAFHRLRKDDGLGGDEGCGGRWRCRAGVWVGTYDAGITRIDGDRRMRLYDPSQDLPSDTVLALAVDAAGTAWAGPMPASRAGPARAGWSKRCRG